MRKKLLSWLVWFCNKVHLVCDFFFYFSTKPYGISFVKGNGPEEKKKMC